MACEHIGLWDEGFFLIIRGHDGRVKGILDTRDGLGNLGTCWVYPRALWQSVDMKVIRGLDGASKECLTHSWVCSIHWSACGPW